MLRAFKVIPLVALLAVVAIAGVIVGCGSDDAEPSSSPSASASADTTKAYKIGITQLLSHPALDSAVAAFKAALAEKGFTNVTYDLQNAEGDMATTAAIAQKFAAGGLDLILAVGTANAQAVVKADKTTPIVFTAITDPVGSGLVTNPEAPEANVTGVSDMQPVEPILALAKQFNPEAKSVGMVYNSGESNSVFLVEAAKKAAGAMGLEIVEATASNSSEVQAAAKSLIGRVDAIAVIGDNTAVTALEAIVKVCNENKIPLLVGDPDSVKRGAAAGYGFDYAVLGKQAGYQAALILTGTPIKDIPVEFAKDLQFSINETAAAAQGVTIPADLVAKAVNKF